MQRRNFFIIMVFLMLVIGIGVSGQTDLYRQQTKYTEGGYEIEMDGILFYNDTLHTLMLINSTTDKVFIFDNTTIDDDLNLNYNHIYKANLSSICGDNLVWDWANWEIDGSAGGDVQQDDLSDNNTDQLSEGVVNFWCDLARIKSECTNDFHNIGGVDDDVPDNGDLGIIDTEAEFEAELFPVLVPGEGGTGDGDTSNWTLSGDIVYPKVDGTHIQGNASLNISADEDVITRLGRAKIGYIDPWTDYAAFAHYDMLNVNDFGMLQTNDGTLYLNSPTNMFIYLSNNGINFGRITADEFNFHLTPLKFGNLWGSEDVELSRPTKRELYLESDYGDAFLEVAGQVNATRFKGSGNPLTFTWLNDTYAKMSWANASFSTMAWANSSFANISMTPNQGLNTTNSPTFADISLTLFPNLDKDSSNDIESGDTADGDLGGTYPNPSVDDDSHSHTGATLSAIPYSDLTETTSANWKTVVSDEIDEGMYANNYWLFGDQGVGTTSDVVFNSIAGNGNPLTFTWLNVTYSKIGHGHAGYATNWTRNLAGGGTVYTTVSGDKVLVNNSITGTSFYGSANPLTSSWWNSTWANITTTIYAGDTFSSDVTGTLESDGDTALAVVDDSHAHTSATVSGLDISADTDLTATLPIVLTDDDLSHSTADGYKHIPSAGAATQILQYTAAGTAKWITMSTDATLADGGAVTVVDDSHNHVYSNIDATTSVNWDSICSDDTGSGSWVFATSPTLVTPILGVASATSLDTGEGANELFDMDQNVLTTSIPTFAGLITPSITTPAATDLTINARGGDLDLTYKNITNSGNTSFTTHNNHFVKLYSTNNVLRTGGLTVDVPCWTGDVRIREYGGITSNYYSGVTSGLYVLPKGTIDPSILLFGRNFAGALAEQPYLRLQRNTGSNDSAIYNSHGFMTITNGVTTKGINTTCYSLNQTGYTYSTKGYYTGGFTSGKLIDDASNGGISSALYIGNLQIQTVSDKRIKTNIVPTTVNALEIIGRLAEKVVDFNFNDPTDISYNNKNARGTYTGINAQDMVNITPFAVAAPRVNDSKKSIDWKSNATWFVEYQNLVPILIKGMSEQQNIIEEQNNTIRELSEKLDALEEKLDNIMNHPLFRMMAK